MREVSLDDEDVFWMNTVPYKPTGNKPWSLAVRRRCQRPLLELLLRWQDGRGIAFGEAAFRWFGMTGNTAHAEINQFLPKRRSAGFGREFVAAPGTGHSVWPQLSG
jgi:hypothetical protein